MAARGVVRSLGALPAVLSPKNGPPTTTAAIISVVKNLFEPEDVAGAPLTERGKSRGWGVMQPTSAGPLDTPEAQAEEEEHFFARVAALQEAEKGDQN